MMDISGGVIHPLPDDLKQTLASDARVCLKWENLTPLARNEWICWVTFVKKEETRKKHIVRLVAELKEGKKRPCCWIGCIHRKDKQLSPSVVGILKSRNLKVS